MNTASKFVSFCGWVLVICLVIGVYLLVKDCGGNPGDALPLIEQGASTVGTFVQDGLATLRSIGR